MIKNRYKKWWAKGIENYIFAGIVGLFFICVATLPVSAITSDIARWYSSEQSLEGGKIVSIRNDKGDYVESAVLGANTKLLGVVVPESEALVSINELKDGVQVAIAGRSEAEVNASNGPISRGDLIGLSNISGVGAKARQGQPVVGVAEASFGNSGDAQSNKSGKIPIVVSVGVAPASLSNNGASSTTWLKSIAGRDVSALQLAFVFFIAAVGIIAIIVLSYSSIRSGVVAVGRNPLAKPAILRALSQAMIMVSLVAISCFSLMYFMLRL